MTTLEAPVERDIRFLVSVVAFYRAGGFDKYDLPIRVANALDSLAEMYPHNIADSTLNRHDINLALKDNLDRATIRKNIQQRRYRREP